MPLLEPDHETDLHLIPVSISSTSDSDDSTIVDSQISTSSTETADSIGLKGSPKKRRKIVRIVHSYW